MFAIAVPSTAQDGMSPDRLLGEVLLLRKPLEIIAEALLGVTFRPIAKLRRRSVVYANAETEPGLFGRDDV
jgi:hypothetical protein